MADDQRAILVRKMVDEGTSDDDIRATLKVFDGQQAAPHAPSDYDQAKARTMATAGGDAPSAIWQRVKDHPIEAAAMLGSTLASGGASALGKVGLAALGAAGGAGYGLLGKGAATGDYGTPTGNAATMATAGAGAAAGEGLGQGAQKILSVGGKLIYKTALRPSMALQRDFGDIAQAGLEAGVPVSEAGLTQAGALKSASADTAKQMIAAAAPGAAPVRVATEVGAETKPIIQRAGLRATTGLSDESPQIVNRIKSMQKSYPGGIDLNRAQALKGELQDLAQGVYRAQDKGAAVTDLGADTNAAMAKGLRKAIESRVPGVGPVNEQTQTMMGLERAIENATMRNVPAVGSLRTLLGDFVPNTASRVGIAAHGTSQLPIPAASRLAALLAALDGGGQ